MYVDGENIAFSCKCFTQKPDEEKKDYGSQKEPVALNPPYQP